MNIEIPKVSKANKEDQEFDPEKILMSLVKETSISYDNAKMITMKVTSFIISSNIRFLSGPLIREIVNVQLLQHGFEKHRLKYTRIGFPYADLTHILDFSGKKLANDQIIFHIKKEYEAVKKLIEERE